MNAPEASRVKRLDPLVGAALLVWLAWLVGSGLLWWQYRARVMHPHFFPLVPLVLLQLLATAGAVSWGLWRIVRGPRRWAAFCWVLAALIPALLWAAHTSYIFATLADGRMPADWADKTAVVAGAALADAEARVRYPRRLSGERVVMLYDRVDHPQEDLAAMDRHVARLEHLLGRPMRGKVHWVRGTLLGLGPRAFQGLATGYHDDGPNDVDRHEVAHVVLNHHLPPDAEPPTLLGEGWAVCHEGRAIELPLALAWSERRDGTLPTLRELFGPHRYAQMDPSAYFYGGPLVEYLLRRFGAEKFFQLYSTCRQETFAADFQRILGLGLDELEAEFWEDADRRIHEQLGVIDPSAWSLFDLPDPGPTDEAAREEFLAHYPEAAEKLRVAYTHARITAEQVSESQEANGAEARPPSIAELEMVRNGDRARFVRRGERATNASVATPNVSFSLKKIPDDDRFHIAQFASASPVGYRSTLRRLHGREWSLHAAYGIVDWSVLRWLAEPGFRIISVVRSEEDDRELITVHFRNAMLALEGGPLPQAGWFSLCPDDGWAIQEYELHTQSPDGLQWHVRAEYGAEKNGVPALDRVRADWRGGDQRTGRITTKVKTLEFGPVPDSEFELAAFGLQPPPKGEVHQKNIWRRTLHATAWALTAVVLTLLLTLTLHFAVRRPIMRRRQPAVPLTNDAERSP
ncbi:MAG: hypothetical protein HQ582_17775 [Planctomycetes bacterium]|nr:hypothetical protein [Planctomycetota bacterium]